MKPAIVENQSHAKAIAYTARRQVQLIDWKIDASPLRPNEVAGRTLVTLVSPGTEINGGFDVDRSSPEVGGYAAVFEVEAVGSEVSEIAPGQRVFCRGLHASHQRMRCEDVIAVPDGLPAEHAVFARLMGVNWTTLVTTAARPADRVVIFGLGPVGNLAAQMFRAAGYRVMGIDPAAARRELAMRCGIADVASSATEREDWVDHVALAIDCSGHEQAVVDACRMVRKKGEVVLIGVPWKRRSDVYAFEITHAVFHRYVVLRSGWEWELPLHAQDFAAGSVTTNLASALSWLADRRVRVEELFTTADPSNAQSVYESLLLGTGSRLSTVFQWHQKP